MPSRITVVGMVGDTPYGPVEGDLIVGGHRQLAAVGVEGVPIEGDVDAVLRAVEAEPGHVCVLASGDPGFFGIVRPLAARFGPSPLDVHPAPSSVALAFARAGCNWDDAAVVSAHGRPLADAAAIAAERPKAAVLVSPDNPPEALGKELLRLGAVHQKVLVCSRLGLHDEQVTATDLPGLAAGTWDPLSVVVLLADAATSTKAIAWSVLPEQDVEHRQGMITKAEVRAVALSKLDLPPATPGVFWDVGAGSGSVAIDVARTATQLDVYAVERNAEDVRRIEANAERVGGVKVVYGEAPAALDALPDPDRVFVGGGGLGVLDAVLDRLKPGGRVVATFAAFDRAAAAADRLGHVSQIAASRGERLPDGGWRLAAENPVFVVWGPTP